MKLRIAGSKNGTKKWGMNLFRFVRKITLNSRRNRIRKAIEKRLRYYRKPYDPSSMDCMFF